MHACKCHLSPTVISYLRCPLLTADTQLAHYSERLATTLDGSTQSQALLDCLTLKCSKGLATTLNGSTQYQALLDCIRSSLDPHTLQGMAPLLSLLLMQVVLAQFVDARSWIRKV